MDIIEQERRRGRGARGNPANRYDRAHKERVWDGWDLPEEELPLRTEVSEEFPRSILAKNSSPDIPFDISINPYRGCEHGCIYCFARPSHAWLGMSPGLDFETRLVAKPSAPALLEKALAAPGYKPQVIAIGTNTDPYQPVEKERQVMRRLLEVLAAHRHPVAITTKGTLIERDIDVLAPMAEQGLVRVGLSITTLDVGLSRAMEPRVPVPQRRLTAIRRLSEAGIPVRLMIAPVVPALTDHELEKLVEAGAEAGAVAASYIVLRLPLEVAPLFRDWLTEHYPDRAARVMGRVQELHGGKDYDPEWGRRMTGRGTWAELLRHRFALATERHGLSRKLPPLRTDLFAVPPKPGDQLSLFG
ncbi:PA0069 family radical SAM protein [Pseudoroseicyclus sp. H15]